LDRDAGDRVERSAGSVIGPTQAGIGGAEGIRTPDLCSAIAMVEGFPVLTRIS
jgi:hypothetical protein